MKKEHILRLNYRGIFPIEFRYSNAIDSILWESTMTFFFPELFYGLLIDYNLNN